MSRLPEELDRKATVAAAAAVMKEHDIHHLPVMDGFHLYGIIASSDLRNAVSKQGPSGSALLEDACTRDVLTVEPTDKLVEVARGMLERAVGSALVCDGDIVVGIVTKSDALRALCDMHSPA